MLANCPKNKTMFRNMSSSFAALCNDSLDESNFISKFSKMHFDEKWENWYATCSQIPGVPPHSNVIEGHNYSGEVTLQAMKLQIN